MCHWHEQNIRGKLAFWSAIAVILVSALLVVTKNNKPMKRVKFNLLSRTVVECITYTT